MKTGVKNDNFWSEIGSGFGESGGTSPPSIPRFTPQVKMLEHYRKIRETFVA